MPELRPFLLITTLVTFTAASYQDAYNLERTLFSNYSTRIRPVQNHNRSVKVSCVFQILTIVGIDEIQGQMSILAMLHLSWMDEKLRWEPSDHGNISYLHPYPKDLWRPRLQLKNSLHDFDLSEDKHDFLLLEHTGQVLWYPGGHLRFMCLLNLQKFPFDSHNCLLIFRTISSSDESIVLFKELSTQGVFTKNYKENGEWVLKSMKVSILVNRQRGDQILLVVIKISRRPEFFVIKFLIPVMLLSILNLLSFTMVAGDGSVNISYSMTVLLAYTIYMSVLLDHLPSVSTNMPYLAYYLSVLFLISLLTTVDIIFIVWLNNKEEEEERKQKVKSKLKAAMNNLFNIRAMSSGVFSHSERSASSKRNTSTTPCARGSQQTTARVDVDSIPNDPLTSDILHRRDKPNVNDGGDSVMTRHQRVNRYKYLSEKVRVKSMYFFMVLNVLATCVVFFILFTD